MYSCMLGLLQKCYTARMRNITDLTAQLKTVMQKYRSEHREITADRN